MGNRRSVALVLASGVVDTTTLTDVALRSIPGLMNYQSRWALPSDPPLAHDALRPPSWKRVPPPEWVGQGIHDKIFYRDTQDGRDQWWMQKRDSQGWREVMASQILRTLGMPVAPTTYADGDFLTNTPLWDRTYTGQGMADHDGVDLDAITIAPEDAPVTVAMMASQWLINNTDGHAGNFLLREVAPQQYSLMPIDFGESLTPCTRDAEINGTLFWTEYLTDRRTATRWLGAHLSPGSCWPYAQFLWGATDHDADGFHVDPTTWDHLVAWADQVSQTPRSQWGDLAGILDRFTDNPQTHGVLDEFYDRVKGFGRCMRALQFLYDHPRTEEEAATAWG